MAAPIAIDAASRALARARDGSPTILSTAGRLGPLAARAMRPPDASTPQIAWIAEDGEAWIAWGEAARLEAETAAEGPAIADRCRAWLDGVIGPGRTLARWFGAMAFQSGETPLGDRGPAALFVLPEAIVRVTADGAEAAVFRAVDPALSPDAVEGELQAAWAALEAHMARPAAPAAWPAVSGIVENRPAWCHAVETAIEALAAGRLDKVVLARPIRLVADGPWQPWEVFRAIADRAPGTQRFLWHEPGCHAFLGASPERLFAESAGRIQVDCLAGTAPCGEDPDRDLAHGEALLASDKDRREHAWVVRAVVEALAPYTEDLTMPGAPVLKRLANVQHLHTPAAARLAPGAGLGDVLRALHPTPAVGGFPRLEAMALLAELEGLPRGWYAGPIGWIGAESSQFAVAIRSAYLRGPEAAVMAGAGIVKGSEPDREWEETARKAWPLVRLLTEGPA